MRCTMKSNEKVIVLSSYFNSNVILIAGVCWKCYAESDVKIVSVNDVFLKKFSEKCGLKPSQWSWLFEKLVEVEREQACDVKMKTEIDSNIFKKLKTSDNTFVESREKTEPAINPAVSLKSFTRHVKLENDPLYIDDIKTKLDTSDFSIISDDDTPPGSQRALWTLPRSPHNLIEEDLYHNPWSLLVATIFLNKTSCMSARPYIEEFIKDYPTPELVIKKRPEDLEPYFTNIGLKKRAVQVWRMSHDFVHKKWRDVGELYGIGRYGRDAFRIFCLGDLESEPNDRFLKIYRAWYIQESKKCDNDEGFDEDRFEMSKNDVIC